MKKIWLSLQKYKNIFKIAVYLFFIFLMISIAMAYTILGMRIFVIITLIVVLAFNILFDYLKFILEKLQIALTVHCDFKEVESLRTKFIKADILRGMKNDLIIFDTLYLLDQNKTEELIEHINRHEKFFSGHLDYLFIKYHSLIKAYSLNYDKEKVNEYFEHINKLRETSLRRRNRQMSLLYNWDQIDGLHALSNHQFNTALKKYKNCDIRNMNPRELLHYNYELAAVYRGLSQNKNSRECIEEIVKINPQSPFAKGVL